MPTLLNRLIRAAGSAAALVLMGTALVLGWDWLKVIGSAPSLSAVSGDRVSGGIPCQLLRDPDGGRTRHGGFGEHRMAVTVAIDTGPMVAFMWFDCSWAGLGGGCCRGLALLEFTVCRRCHIISPGRPAPMTRS